MANLTRSHRWEKYFPPIGENLELPEGERLAIEVAVGLSPAALAAWRKSFDGWFRELPDVKQGDAAGISAIAVAAADKLAAVFEGVARLVGEHSIAGKPVVSLRDFFAVLIGDVAGMGAEHLTELRWKVEDWNSIQGATALFFARRSGGSASTRTGSAAKASESTAAR